MTGRTRFDGIAFGDCTLGQPGQRVELAHRPYDRTSLAVGGDEGRLDTADACLHVEAGLLQDGS